MRPKPTALTFTLYRPHSFAIVFVRPITPALPDEYPAWPAFPSVPAIEVMFTTLRMTRWPAAISVLAASRMYVEAARQNAKRRHQMDVDHRLKLLVRGLLDNGVPGITRVIDNNVDAAEVLDRGPDETLGELSPR